MTSRGVCSRPFVFLNNRHYDPTTGVFISVDPLVAKTMQPYLYGNANPVRYMDPSGRVFECPPGGVPPRCETRLMLASCWPWGCEMSAGSRWWLK